MALRYNYINYTTGTGTGTGTGGYISTAGMDYTKIAYGPAITWVEPPPPIATAMKHCALGLKQVYLQISGCWYTFTKAELENRVHRLKKAGLSHEIDTMALDEMIW